MLNFTGMYACKMKMEVKAVFTIPMIRAIMKILLRHSLIRELSRSNRG